MQSIDDLIAQARSAFAAAMRPAELENEKARFLGKAGVLTERLRALAQLDPDRKRTEGARLNAAKEAIEQLLAQRRAQLAEAELDAQLALDAIDVTLPGRVHGRGAFHPVIRTWMRVEQIFRSIGFDVADGPEIETDWYNFTALNNPENHPARSMQDTFYVGARDAEGRPLVLRTHTSPMQVRYARQHRGPIRVIAAGRTHPAARPPAPSPRFSHAGGPGRAGDHTPAA